MDGRPSQSATDGILWGKPDDRSFSLSGPGKPNVEAGVGRGCRVINRRAEGWRSGLKEPDDVSEVAREHRPDEPGKGPATLFLIGGGANPAFEQITIGRSGFLWWVIVFIQL
jgi:hypothetical protein